MGGQGHEFGSNMPPRLDKKSDSGRIIIIATEDLLERIDEWRARRRPLPNKSEAGRRLLETALRAEAGDLFVEEWTRNNIHNDPFMGDDINDRVQREVDNCISAAIKANVFLTHPALERSSLADVIQEAIESTHDPDSGGMKD